MTTKTKPKAKKRMIRGRDFDAWACKNINSGGWNSLNIYGRRPPLKDIGHVTLHPDLRWVRVKFVEVKP